MEAYILQNVWENWWVFPVPLFTTVKTGVAHFKRGSTRIQNAECSGRPKSDKIEDVI